MKGEIEESSKVYSTKLKRLWKIVFRDIREKENVKFITALIAREKYDPENFPAFFCPYLA